MLASELNYRPTENIKLLYLRTKPTTDKFAIYGIFSIGTKTNLKPIRQNNFFGRHFRLWRWRRATLTGGERNRSEANCNKPN